MKPPKLDQNANNVSIILNKMLDIPVNVKKAFSQTGQLMLILSARSNVPNLELKQQLVIIVPVRLIILGPNVISHVNGQTLIQLLMLQLLIPKQNVNVKQITF
jgi:hypothetical protein